MKTAIINEVENRPGIHFRELQRNVECTKTTLNYHINNTELLKDEKIRGYRRIFTSDIPRQNKSVLAALNHEPRGEIIYLVHNEEPTVKEISEKVEKSPSTVSHHLNVLKEADIIEKQRSYAIKQENIQAVKKYASKFLETRVDEFIRMWE